MIAEMVVERLKAKYVCVRACVCEREGETDRQEQQIAATILITKTLITATMFYQQMYIYSYFLWKECTKMSMQNILTQRCFIMVVGGYTA